MSATTAVVTARNGGRVLVVDDSAVIRQAISKMLKVDFDVAVAADGEAGWETLLQAPDVGVLITDIEMPRLDGYAFICRVRASDDARIRELPIIVITGADDDETKTRAFACGATDFITKPLNLAQLQACTQAYMRFEQPVPEEASPYEGLLGRDAFHERGEALLREASAQRPVTLLLAALDRVRILYREYGDEQMEAVVGHVATVLRDEAGADVTAMARLGGAEFGILMGGTSKGRGLVLAQRLVGAFAHRPIHDGKTLSISVGVGSSEEGAAGCEALRQMAEERLKRAVALGGNRASGSALSDTLGGAEELVLDGIIVPGPPAESGGDAGPEVLFEPEFMPEPVVPPAFSVPGPATRPVAMMGLDRAVCYLRDGRGAELEPFLDLLTSEVVVLLEFLNARRGLGLNPVIAALRQSVPADPGV
ncbi:response regulator [Acidiferrobacter sp. SPIII_3]|uniref:response regulator n=1 Tax=Acidiferrobacter sp. SPIII_3 TaxID=1281578 RepID=UPI00143DC57E|nr:response regulator [Acidiferrobacter sp. SPIII_3]